MKFGLFGMNMRPCITPEAIATVARAAEDAGFESFWGGEHLALADPQIPASPMPPRIDFGDLNVTMAFAAAHTHKLRFGTGIMILPLRNPVVLAKQLASVDVMSDGRLIFWEPTTGQEILTLYDAHLDCINAVVFSADGSHLASASCDGTAIFWNGGPPEGD